LKLTPLEVRKQSFRKSMRGFDAEEVRIFLDMVADEYERLLQENGMLSEKVRYLNERLEEYHNLEKTLQNSILTAERVAAESRERSRMEAQTIINDAHVRAERILDDSRNRLRLLGDQIHHLSTQKDLFVQRFQSLLSAQGQFLQGHQEELETIEDLDARVTELLSEQASVTGEAPEAGAGPEPLPEEPRGPGADPLVRPPAAAPLQQRESEAGEVPDEEAWAKTPESATHQGDDFFRPEERREGFFELSAGTEEGTQQ